MAGGTVSAHLEADVGKCERLSLHAKVAHPRDDLPTSPNKSAPTALLSERKDYKNGCETATLDNLCIPGLATEAEE